MNNNNDNNCNCNCKDKIKKTPYIVWEDVAIGLALGVSIMAVVISLSVSTKYKKHDRNYHSNAISHQDESRIIDKERLRRRLNEFKVYNMKSINTTNELLKENNRLLKIIIKNNHYHNN